MCKGWTQDKFLIPFIEGKPLSRVSEATVVQKETGKVQLSGAISSLNRTGLTWSDVAPRIFVIDKGTEEAMLLDIAFSHLEGTEGSEHNIF